MFVSEHIGLTIFSPQRISSLSPVYSAVALTIFFPSVFSYFIFLLIPSPSLNLPAIISPSFHSPSPFLLASSFVTPISPAVPSLHSSLILSLLDSTEHPPIFSRPPSHSSTSNPLFLCLPLFLSFCVPPAVLGWNVCLRIITCLSGSPLLLMIRVIVLPESGCVQPPA